MFASKISSDAKAADVQVQIVRSVAKLAEADGAFLLVDGDVPEFVDAAAAWKIRSGRPVVVFVSHVNAAGIAAARAAGLERVMSRGGFDAALRSLLTSLTGPS